MIVEAVRWAHRELKRQYTLDYTKWHATGNLDITFCGLQIPVGLRGTFFPENEHASKVDCKRCLRKLNLT